MVCMWSMMSSLGPIRLMIARCSVLFILAFPFPTLLTTRLIRLPVGRVARTRLPHISHSQWEVVAHPFR